MQKMKFFVPLFLLTKIIVAQDAVHNYGNLKLHDQAAVGFHIDLINDGIFDENLGLVGFYNENMPLTISGAFRPIFFDTEIAVDNNLFLEVGVGVKNNSNFIVGDVVTPRTLPDVNLDYIDDAFYTGNENLTKADGYSAISNKNDFIFPIGDANKLRQLAFYSQTGKQNAKSAYFIENPNNPTTFITSFNTENRTDILTAVSTYEFWDLDASEVSAINISWDSDSQLANFVDEIENLRVVGWNTENGIWEDLGGTSINGDLTNGNITSDSFIPDNYSVLTFGSSLSTENINLGNYLLTPNGDGTNDFLFIDAVALSPNNQINIYNRWGREVYSEKDYTNSFDGTTNVNFVVASKKKLPAGLYFYVIELHDINKIHQGYLFLQD